jgi:hypothetical protein
MTTTSRAVDPPSVDKIQTADVIGDVFPLEQVGEALDILDSKIPARVAVRVALRLT